MLLSLLLLVLPAAQAQRYRLSLTAFSANHSHPKPKDPQKTSKPTHIGSDRPERPKLPPPRKPDTTTTPPPTTSTTELPTCNKERICDSKRNSEGFRELVVALHRELRRELNVDTWYFSDEGLKELNLEYSCELEKLAHQRIQSCRKALYSSKTHNSAVIRRHLGQEKVLAFLKAFSYWRNDKEKRINEDFKPHTDFDKLSWDSLSAIGCAVKQCKKRGQRFTLVDCKYDYTTYGNVSVPY